MFKHKLGHQVESRSTGLKGIISQRAECLYGCNRYLIQPRVEKESKVPDSWWVDEDDIILYEQVIVKNENETGGPISRHN